MEGGADQVLVHVELCVYFGKMVGERESVCVGGVHMLVIF